MHHAKGDQTFPSPTDIRNLITAESRQDCQGKTWKDVFAGGATSLTERSILRAKAHEFTLHEALIAESCGSNVEFLIYSLWPSDVPDSSKLRGQRQRRKCVEMGEYVFQGKQTHHLLWKPLLKIYWGRKCYCYPNWKALVSFGMEHTLKMAYVFVTPESILSVRKYNVGEHSQTKSHLQQ